ncbi:hypothetical protein GCM10008171_05840 [Methylopila jiangsuensis]|uniref:Uncharacterized protein n=1 Tax=Methylopila jiangsuensis TaxID=586230 RepID=A0A9W6JD18_9HYPH|nr:hypothetical protein [Methylopila jiangsuensis]MDR6285572.1 hypothetical protein [Methylopila jiangsuensis]GLK75330.1 hypothetical protein GCM10008171_05840 [Methylopila jiangsuensis]
MTGAPPPSPEDKAKALAALALARDILPNSGTMIGVCTTLVGLVKIIERDSGASRVDEYGALIGVLFLISALTSYWAIRVAPTNPLASRRCERVADVFFLTGLCSLVVLGALFAFETV